MADAGLLPFREPFTHLQNQGQLMGPDGRRMSKSRGNVITPDSITETFGADALRIYEMFMAPFDQDIAWSAEGIQGARRFLNRVWGLFGETYAETVSAPGADDELERRLHQTIRRVSQRIEEFRFNTMVSALMEFANFLGERQREGMWRTATFQHALDLLMVLIAPAAPHIAEELWSLTGHAGSVHSQPWPAWDAELARDEIAHIAVQINGKLRAVIEASPGAGREAVEAQARAHPKVQPHLEGREVARLIYVPGKILNMVLK
jgi:leucyl-tRNA synthetase